LVHTELESLKQDARLDSRGSDMEQLVPRPQAKLLSYPNLNWQSRNSGFDVSCLGAPLLIDMLIILTAIARAKSKCRSVEPASEKVCF